MQRGEGRGSPSRPASSSWERRPGRGERRRARLDLRDDDVVPAHAFQAVGRVEAGAALEAWLEGVTERPVLARWRQEGVKRFPADARLRAAPVNGLKVPASRPADLAEPC